MAEPSIAILLKFVQPEKAPNPILETAAGSVIEDRLLQSRKANLPTEHKEDPFSNLTLDNE